MRNETTAKAEKRQIPLIDSWEAEAIRKPGADCPPQGLGSIERRTGTGRATCRECGEKIAKGLPSLEFAYDFKGCGSWTAVMCQIHAAPCKAGA